MNRSILGFGILILALSPFCYAQGFDESPVHWTAQELLRPIRAGESFEVEIRASLDNKWHLYSITQPPGGPIPTQLTLISGAPFRLAGPVRQSPPISQFDPTFGIQTEFFSDRAEFRVALEVDPGTNPGKYQVLLQAFFQSCDDSICLPPRKIQIPVSVQVEPGPARSSQVIAGAAALAPPASNDGNRQLAVSGSGAEGNPAASLAGESPRDSRASAPPDAQAAVLSDQTPAGTAAEVQQARAKGFLPYLWLSITMGALSLATPCVFPMIPITVSYFTKDVESGRKAGLRQAFAYCLGIIFTFTALGLGLAAILGATGINQFAANPWINLVITAVFIGFALNLFGLFQIGVPSSVLTKLSNKSSGRTYAQTLLMGLTFTLTSFTCTVPFVGTVLVATAQGDWLWPALGMLGFSTTFAIPFFVLALLPNLLASFPRSGGWLNATKVTMGFLEIAAAMKFLSNADLVWNWHIFTREIVLAIWIAVAILASAYLLGRFRLPHDTPLENLGVLRMLFALVSLALGVYLFTGLMGRSLGELDAFLPPRTAGAFTLTGGGGQGQELTWNTDLTAALNQANSEEKSVLIDFTGYTCTNCRWMEANIFPILAVRTELAKFVRVQLYTDGSGKIYEQNQQYQKERFGTVALPFYAILDSKGKTIATFPGMTRKPEEFIRFLQTPADKR
jgi:thiol:disulfide interchange protein